MFFDTEIQTSMFFPTLHDAVLHVLDKKNLDQRHNRLVRKTFTQVSDQILCRCQINSQNIDFNEGWHGGVVVSLTARRYKKTPG